MTDHDEPPPPSDTATVVSQLPAELAAADRARRADGQAPAEDPGATVVDPDRQGRAHGSPSESSSDPDPGPTGDAARDAQEDMKEGGPPPRAEPPRSEDSDPAPASDESNPSAAPVPPSPGGSKDRLTIVASVVLIGLTLALGAFVVLMPEPAPENPPGPGEASPPTSAEAEVESPDPGVEPAAGPVEPAPAVDEPKKAGPSPKSAPKRKPRRAKRPAASAAEKPEPKPAAAPSPPPPTANAVVSLELEPLPPGIGKVSARVYVDGKFVGVAPVRGHKVVPGQRRFRFDCVFEGKTYKGTVKTVPIPEYAEATIQHKCNVQVFLGR